MAKWSSLWTTPMSKEQRAEAIKAARFTPPSRTTNKAKQSPNNQPFKLKD